VHVLHRRKHLGLLRERWLLTTDHCSTVCPLRSWTTRFCGHSRPHPFHCKVKVVVVVLHENVVLVESVLYLTVCRARSHVIPRVDYLLGISQAFLHVFWGVLRLRKVVQGGVSVLLRIVAIIGHPLVCFYFLKVLHDHLLILDQVVLGTFRVILGFALTSSLLNLLLLMQLIIWVRTSEQYIQGFMTTILTVAVLLVSSLRSHRRWLVMNRWLIEPPLLMLVAHRKRSLCSWKSLLFRHQFGSLISVVGGKIRYVRTFCKVVDSFIMRFHH